MPNPITIALAVMIGFVVWVVAATAANLLIRVSLLGHAEAELVAVHVALVGAWTSRLVPPGVRGAA
jgi:hypothetical protein